jgi:hypothetical protein
MTTILSLIALYLLERYCKKNNHKQLYYVISAIRKLMRFTDGGAFDSIIEIILNLLKDLF